MDIRVLNYFLTVAQIGNITQAAVVLHITQPTLSRQLMELEQELGTSLFVRGKRHITLTDSGILFQQRAKEIVALLDKTERDLIEQKDNITGVIAIGCVETVASVLLADIIAAFTVKYPKVQYEIYSADGDDLREKIDRGAIDIGILVEPVESAKYDFVRLPVYETWGVLTRSDDPLAKRATVQVEDIQDLPLMIPRRTIVKNEIQSWLGVETDRLHIIASHNLLSNVTLLVERKVGYALGVKGAFTIRENDALCFIPFSPERTTGHVLTWKKRPSFNSATSLFIEFVKTFIEK